MASLNELRQAIADAITQEKARHIPARCLSYGLDAGTEEEAHLSKRNYVKDRLIHKDLVSLVTLSYRVLEDYDSDQLRDLLGAFTSSGVTGQAKNLIFAADGPKPEIIFTDAVNNDIHIVKNAEYCLVFDEPFPSDGLRWEFLLTWWGKKQEQEEVEISQLRNTFYERLRKSLDSAPENLLFWTYYKNGIKALGAQLPALVPQVYLHYDPQTFRQLRDEKRLIHQRMDFLLLLPLNVRIVIEIDGKQHYSDGDISSPYKYAQMVQYDRKLQLSGYEIYRFGGAEFLGTKEEISNKIWSFFLDLFRKHKLIK